VENQPESATRTTGSASAVAEATLDLSAIVLSWNSARFLDDCLASLFAQRGVAIEVIVVDNGSTDDSREIVRDRYPRARLVALGSNLGFCAANNIGLGFARGAFVLFANSDIILEVDFAEEALRSFERDPRIGLVGGKLLRFDRRTVDSAGQFLSRSRKVVERGYGAPDGPHTEREGYVFSICGAATVWRGETIQDISYGRELFDESFFAFSEDLDAGWRARIAGWSAWYAPRAVGYHYRGGTEEGPASARTRPAILRRSRTLRYHILKNRWLTLLKNDSLGAVLRDLPFIAARDLALLATAAASPGVLLDLARAAPLAGKARERRRAFLAREGRWGRRRAGARGAWVRWTDPLPSDPA